MRAIRLLIDATAAILSAGKFRRMDARCKVSWRVRWDPTARKHRARWLGTHRRWNARTWTSSPFPHAFIDDDRAHTPRPQRNPTQRYLHTRCRRGRPYFHARFSAKRKRYRYRIHLGKNAVQRHYTWSLHTAADIERMQAASAYLKGTHCFDAFCKQDPVPEQFSCTVYAADWHCKGRELIFEIEGNRFLRHMVRILVGTMVEIGLGKHPPEHLNHLLERGRREEAGKTAPACGLHLLWVHYDNA